ncbi:SRPBCC family protein [Nocardia sp. NPDC046763]|uniref:SRPBCC family protein n=1 Tax=Nocardia sp. NPDC046763 TaxID=3155256 RepID=UPI0033ED802B
MSLLSDPTRLAGLVTREVRTGSRDGVPTRIAVARRSYQTDPADLWDALTNPERIPRWFLPISGRLEVGGRYQLEGHANGVIERCDAPKALAATWEWDGKVSWMEVGLTPVNDGTQLELTHEVPFEPEMWGRFGPGAVGVGWDLTLAGLGSYLSSGEAVDPKEGQHVHRTPEGRVFIRASVTGWGEAAIADGDEPATAQTAADAAYSFYTTEPDSRPES